MIRFLREIRSSSFDFQWNCTIFSYVFDSFAALQRLTNIWCLLILLNVKLKTLQMKRTESKKPLSKIDLLDHEMPINLYEITRFKVVRMISIDRSKLFLIRSYSNQKPMCCCLNELWFRMKPLLMSNVSHSKPIINPFSLKFWVADRSDVTESLHTVTFHLFAKCITLLIHINWIPNRYSISNRS